jgi:hypothetical protein
MNAYGVMQKQTGLTHWVCEPVETARCSHKVDFGKTVTVSLPRFGDLFAHGLQPPPFTMIGNEMTQKVIEQYFALIISGSKKRPYRVLDFLRGTVSQERNTAAVLSSLYPRPESFALFAAYAVEALGDFVPADNWRLRRAVRDHFVSFYVLDRQHRCSGTLFRQLLDSVPLYGQPACSFLALPTADALTSVQTVSACYHRATQPDRDRDGAGASPTPMRLARHFCKTHSRFYNELTTVCQRYVPLSLVHHIVCVYV